MTFTNFNNEEKIRSLIYITNYELSLDEIIEKKQWQMLDILWKQYIKECDYSYIVRAVRTETYNVIYTFIWPDNMTLDALELLLSEFVYRTEQYKKIKCALHEELKNTLKPTEAQQSLVDEFMTYFEDWWTYEVEDFIKMYHTKCWLDNFVNEKFMLALT
jgi:hypothetical protein